MPISRINNSLDLGQIAGRRRRLWLEADARSRHLYVCGATRAGKSKFLQRLIQQDIMSHRNSQCGLLLLDPHGGLYDGIMKWLAANPTVSKHKPILPIDLRRTDRVVSYNPMRRREGVDPAVVVTEMVEAMAHVWGDPGVDQTPRFAAWASNVLHTLYAYGYALTEAHEVLKHEQPRVREALAEQLDPQVAAELRKINGYRLKEFETSVESTANRMKRFTENALMRRILGQTENTLDLRSALEEGHIVLVSLAREGSLQTQPPDSGSPACLARCCWPTSGTRRPPARSPKTPSLSTSTSMSFKSSYPRSSPRGWTRRRALAFT